MCGRYRISDADTPGEMQAIIDELNRKKIPFKTGEIFPSDVVPVIANSKSLSPAPFAMRWGYTLDGGRRVINARSETALQKPLFSDGMQRRRCLIPASSYYEWTRKSLEKTKYEIAAEHASMFYMAGLYRVSNGEAEFTILTRKPADSISFIHDRMPVILPRECLSGWLSPDADPQEILSRAVTDVQHALAPGYAQTISFL